jgi:hypothetical protein
MFEMPQYEFRFHDDTDWREISEIQLMDGLYKIYQKVTPAIKEMIMGKEVETPDGVFRLKNQKKLKSLPYGCINNIGNIAKKQLLDDCD